MSEVAATVVRMVSVRSASVTRQLEDVRKREAGQQLRVAAEVERGDQLVALIRSITRQPGWAASTPWMGKPLSSVRTPAAPGVDVDQSHRRPDSVLALNRFAHGYSNGMPMVLPAET